MNRDGGTMDNARISAKLGPLQAVVDAALEDMTAAHVIPRLWAKDHRLWKDDPREITNRLGWLTVMEEMRTHLPRLTGLARAIRDEGVTDVVLLGMGGSSLGPEVLRCTFGSARGFPRLHVLDSTVPGLVRDITRTIRPAKTLFILASKSGGTIEVMSLYAHFRALIAGTKGTSGGAQFIAVTDPDTGLARLAQTERFRTTFINPPDIGGRYSVLSLFGLVPAALIGLDLATLLGRGEDMAKACGMTDAPSGNPGALLGATMGVLGRSGRDKVTLVTSPKIKSFGLWAEQLLAESTGKEGTGLVPIAEEPLASPAAYGNDRLFVYLRLNGDANTRTDRHLRALERAGQPVVRLTLRDRYDLAAEFFRWEFATAVAGRILGIHPFDQPNVQESKENTSRILEEATRRGALPDVPTGGTLADLLAKAAPGKYLAILAYLRFSPKADQAIKALRRTLLVRHHLATTAGYGPRYLHSTGQLHKGGPDSGLFLQLMGRMAPDVPVPGKPYTFGTLAQAQAIGDVQSLQAHRRPVVQIQLGPQGPAAIGSWLRKPASRRPARKTRPANRLLARAAKRRP